MLADQDRRDEVAGEHEEQLDADETPSGEAPVDPPRERSVERLDATTEVADEHDHLGAGCNLFPHFPKPLSTGAQAASVGGHVHLPDSKKTLVELVLKRDC